MNVLRRHPLPSACSEVPSMRPPISAQHVAVRVGADPVVIRDADELERAVFEQRPLDAAATGIDASAKQDDLFTHQTQPFRPTLGSRSTTCE